jgi:hypothetical protein
MLKLIGKRLSEEVHNVIEIATYMVLYQCIVGISIISQLFITYYRTGSSDSGII